MCRPKRRKFRPPPGWPTWPDGRPVTEDDIVAGMVLQQLREDEKREQARSRPRRRVVRNGAFVNL